MPKPLRDHAYLAYIRTLGCTVCQVTNGIEAHHVGKRGMGQKASDYETIPLCRSHHREFHDLGIKLFVARYHLDIPGILRRLHAKPVMRVESGQYIAYFGTRDGPLPAREYVVGPTTTNLASAVRRVRQLWWEDREIAS